MGLEAVSRRLLRHASTPGVHSCSFKLFETASGQESPIGLCIYEELAEDFPVAEQ